jgi:hypothetical protein
MVVNHIFNANTVVVHLFLLVNKYNVYNKYKFMYNILKINLPLKPILNRKKNSET